MDESRYFQDATLSICSSLAPDEFLFESLKVICKRIPADEIHLTTIDRAKGVHTLLASADKNGGRTQNLSFKVAPEAALELADLDDNIKIMNKASEYFILKPWIEAGLGAPDASALSLKVVAREDRTGAVVLLRYAEDTYNTEHAKLLRALKAPFGIALSNYLSYRELADLKESLVEDKYYLQRDLSRSVSQSVIGADTGLRGVMELVSQVAPLNIPVLLLGETGTGKEVIANAVHRSSPRQGKSFVKINCGAIPETLIDSELFGHEKGAFTGAISRRRGCFERAEGGTLFLDEIGELPLEAQTRLLRVLQENELERVGGSETIAVNVRVIAATNQDLAEMVRQGHFRKDLYFRLNVFPILIPPLRDRKADISLLAQHFVSSKYGKLGLSSIPAFSPAAFGQLASYQWPGNVRELENAIERALILSAGGMISFSDLGGSDLANQKATLDAPLPIEENLPNTSDLTFDEFCAHHIKSALRKANGKISGKGGAAEALGLKPSTLRKKMTKLQIPFPAGTRNL